MGRWIVGLRWRRTLLKAVAPEIALVLVGVRLTVDTMYPTSGLAARSDL